MTNLDLETYTADEIETATAIQLTHENSAQVKEWAGAEAREEITDFRTSSTRISALVFENKEQLESFAHIGDMVVQIGENFFGFNEETFKKIFTKK